jgi:uncharacterized membrane protein
VSAFLGGLFASICFSVSALCASAASRRIGAPATLAWVMLIGLALVIPATAAADTNQLSLHATVLLLIAGLTNVVGLGVEYMAFRRGNVGVITPIVSTEGAIAATIAVIAGLRLSLHTAVLLVVVTAGVIITAADPDPPGPRHGSGVRSAVLAIPVAVLFGISLYTTGRAGREVAVVWVLLSARLIGTTLLAVPLIARSQLMRPRSALPLVAGAGAAEVVGILSYTFGARHQLAITAVLASQFPAFAALGAYFAFGERLTRHQLVGLVVVAIGVGLLAVEGT